MTNDKASTQMDMIPRLFYRRIGICLILFFVVVVLAWQIYLYFQTRIFLEVHYSAVMLKLMRMKEEILFNSIITSLVFFAVPCLLTAAFLVYFSHRIAGPMYRIKRYLKEDVNRPDARDLSFRETDVLHALAAAVNEVQHRYRNDCRALNEELQGIEAALAAATVQQQAGEPMSAALARISTGTNALHDIVTKVKT